MKKVSFSGIYSYWKIKTTKINAMEIVHLSWIPIHIMEYYAVIKFSFENIFLKHKEVFIIYQVKKQKNKLFM